MRYTMLLAIFAAFTLACSNSPQPARSPAPVDETQSPAPAPESPAPAEAAPIPSDASNGDVSGLFQYPQSSEPVPSPRPGVLPIIDPPPLNEDACEIYGPPDDDGLKVLAPGDPEYIPRVSALIVAFQSMTRGTPTPEQEEQIARLPYLSDCLERALE